MATESASSITQLRRFMTRHSVTIQDLDGTSHSAEVTASSLFEAVAQGLSALRKNEWVEGIEERFGIVKGQSPTSESNIKSKSQIL